MSVSKLNKRQCAGYFMGACLTNVQKRWVHRSPDYGYLEAGFQKSSYKKIFESNAAEMQQFPEFTARYLKVAAAMRCRKMVPLVHAQSAAFRVPSIFLRTMSSNGPKQGFYKFLRQPASEYCIDREELLQRIDAFCKTHGEVAWTPGVWNGVYARLDNHPSLKSHLVSASYSLMDFGHQESAAYFLFRNSNATGVEEGCQTANKAIERALKKYGLESRVSMVLKSLEPFYAEYEKLKLGTLYVIGVPEEKIDRFAYDSKSFGVPSKHKISAMVGNLGASLRAHSDEEGGLQARILMYKETLDPSCGIEVVDVNAEEEAETFCKGFALASPASVFKHTRLFEKRITEVERDNAQKQKLLDEQVKDFALSIKSCLL